MDRHYINCMLVLRDYVPEEIARFIISMTYCYKKMYCKSNVTCFLVDGVLHKIPGPYFSLEKVICPEKINLVSLGYGHSIVVTDLNQIHTWGDNSVGQLGVGHNHDSM